MRTAPALFIALIAVHTPLGAAETVPVSAFHGIALRGGGTVTVRPGPVQSVTIVRGNAAVSSISTDADRKLEIHACRRQCPAGYELQIEVRSPQVPHVAISGGGSIRVDAGFAHQSEVAAAVDGGGTIDLRSVAAHSVAATVNGGGLIRTGRATTLAAAINGGGTIRYSGDPAVHSAVRGGGSVARE